jgi:hypothetical protein
MARLHPTEEAKRMNHSNEIQQTPAHRLLLAKTPTNVTLPHSTRPCRTIAATALLLLGAQMFSNGTNLMPGSSAASAATPQASEPKATAPKKLETKPLPSNAASVSKGNTTVLTITTSEFLKSNVSISVPVGTKAQKMVDSPTTVLTFPDGAQMSVQPDASTFSDYKKNMQSTEDTMKTPAKDRATFVLETDDRLIFSDNYGNDGGKRTVFVMQKKLPKLTINKALATGMLCSDTGLQSEKEAPNRASIDAMMAACDTIISAK